MAKKKAASGNGLTDNQFSTEVLEVCCAALTEFAKTKRGRHVLGESPEFKIIKIKGQSPYLRAQNIPDSEGNYCFPLDNSFTMDVLFE